MLFFKSANILYTMNYRLYQAYQHEKMPRHTKKIQSKCRTRIYSIAIRKDLNYNEENRPTKDLKVLRKTDVRDYNQKNNLRFV
jgi:hypothetical protein